MPVALEAEVLWHLAGKDMLLEERVAREEGLCTQSAWSMMDAVFVAIRLEPSSTVL